MVLQKVCSHPTLQSGWRECEIKERRGKERDSKRGKGRWQRQKEKKGRERTTEAVFHE